MKDSKTHFPPEWQGRIEQARQRPVPQVNVRSRVRAALEAEAASPDGIDAAALAMVDWFSGIRGRVFAGVALALLATLAVFAYREASGILSMDAGDDEVTQFMQNGDWSDWL